MKKAFYMLSFFLVLAAATQAMAVVDDCFGGPGGTKPNDPTKPVVVKSKN